MEKWLITSLILCVFGFLKEFRPSEPFITPYLSDKNFTNEQISEEIYPVGTYATLAQLPLVFLITDFLRYKWVILLEGLSGVTTWTLLIVGTNIPAMQAVEFFYGTFIASEVAYFTYIYAQVPKEKYQQVTSYTRAAFLIGRSLSAICSQFLYTFHVLSTYELNFLSVGALSLATLWVFFLPGCKKSLYFYRNNESEDSLETSKKTLSFTKRCIRAYSYLWDDFTLAYSNFYVLKWSIWYAIQTCGFVQVLTYIQIVWSEILKENGNENEELWYGAVEAVYTLLAALVAFLIGLIRLNWKIFGEGIFSLASFAQMGLVLGCALTNEIVVGYVVYILFAIIYHSSITIASSEIAKHISEESYGLIFGINTFVALIFQTILTTIVNKVYKLSGRMQFEVYAGYYGILGIVFLVFSILTLSRTNFRQVRYWIRDDEETPEEN